MTDARESRPRRISRRAREVGEEEKEEELERRPQGERRPRLVESPGDLFHESGVCLTSGASRALATQERPFRETDYVRVFVRRANIGNTLSKLRRVAAKRASEPAPYELLPFAKTYSYKAHARDPCPPLFLNYIYARSSSLTSLFKLLTF